MPFSWIRVPNHESDAVRKAIGANYTRQQFVGAVTKIVTEAGGEDVEVYYELNGKWTRVFFRWQQYSVKKKVMLQLNGEDALDLLKVKQGNTFER
jgi:hypothetical protein